MNPEIKTKWVEALRSGEYKQGKSVLRSEDGFCCLGVLCDVYSKENEETWGYRSNSKYSDSVVYAIFETEDILPQEVANWAGLSNRKILGGVDPAVMAGETDSIGQSVPSTLSSLNDGGKSFSQIADLIEAQL